MSNRDYLPADLYYGDDFVAEQSQKYRNRHSNYWKLRIASVMNLIGPVNNEEIKVLDLACSIGAFTIECALRGYTAIGVDFSPLAIGTAKQLAAEQSAHKCNFVIGDVTQLSFPSESFDVVVASDIVEHLFDEPLLRMFCQAYISLKPGGHMVIHTTPTRYSYLFSTWRALPLVPFAWLPQPLLDRSIEWYEAYPFSLLYKLIHGDTKQRLAMKQGHCNCPSYFRLSGLLQEAGFVLEKYYADHAPEDFQRPGFRWLSQVFRRSIHVRGHIWAVCRKASQRASH